MITQDIEKSKSGRIPVWGYDMCVSDDDIWIFHGTLNALFKFNAAYREMKYVLSVEGERELKKCLFIGIHYYKGKIFLIPRSAEKFVVYDIDKEVYRTFESNNNYNIESVFAYGKYLYCKPVYIKEKILKIDLERERIVGYICLPDEIRTKYGTAFFNDICFISDNRLAGVIYPSNKYYIFNLDTEEFHILSAESGSSFSSLEFCKGYLYLYDLEDFTIHRVIPDSGEIVSSFKTSDRISRLVGVWEKYIIIDLTQEGKTYLFDTDDGRIFELAVNDIKRNDEEDTYRYCHGIYRLADDGRAYYLNRYNNRLYMWKGSIDLLTDGVGMYVSETEAITMKRRMALNLEKFSYENKIIGLRELIANLINGENQ